MTVALAENQTQSTTSSENSQGTQTTQAQLSEPATPPVVPQDPTPVPAPAPVIPDVPSPEAPPAEPTPPKQEEEYDLELSPDSPLSAEELNEIAEEAGRLGLTKADAEKLITSREGAYKKGMSKVQQQYEEKIREAHKKITTDPEFSGDKGVVAWESVSRAVNAFGDQELVDLLKTPEVGNSITIARFLKRLGDAMAQDTLPGKGYVSSESDGDNTTLAKLYPSFFKKS